MWKSQSTIVSAKSWVAWLFPILVISGAEDPNPENPPHNGESLCAVFFHSSLSSGPVPHGHTPAASHLSVWQIWDHLRDKVLGASRQGT